MCGCGCLAGKWGLRPFVCLAAAVCAGWRGLGPFICAAAAVCAGERGPCHICSKDWYKLDCHCRERIRGEMANDAQIPWPKGCPDCGATLEVVIENNIH